MTTNSKLILGIVSFILSLLMFYFGKGEILSIIRVFLLAIGVVFIIRSLIEKYRK